MRVLWLAYDLLLASITAGLTLALVLVGLAQVFFRYVVQSSLFWTEELSRYLLIWLVVLGAALAVQNRSHIAVEMLVERFSRRWRRRIARLSLVLMIGFCVILVSQGGQFALRSMSQQSTTLPISMGLVYLALPVGGVLMIVEALRLLFEGTTAQPLNVREEPL